MQILHSPPPLTKGMRVLLGRKRQSEKETRDAIRVWSDARGYIGIDKDGNVLRAHVQPKGRLPVIAVVVEMEFGSGLVLEIGLNRTTPYEPAEFIDRRGERKRVARRARVREITRHELGVVYPMIEEMLEYLVTHQRSTWQHPEEWWVKGLSRPVYRGIGIRIDKRDSLMYRQVLLEDIETRKKNIARLTRSISWWLRRYKYVTGYSKRQLVRLGGAQRVAEALSWQVDHPLHVVTYTRKSLGAFSNGNLWVLCEHILTAFGQKRVDDDAVYAMYEFLYKKRGPHLPQLRRLRVRLETERQGKFTHGQGCATLEIFPTQELVSESEKLLKGSADDDIPF